LPPHLVSLCMHVHIYASLSLYTHTSKYLSISRTKRKDMLNWVREGINWLREGKDWSEDQRVAGKEISCSSNTSFKKLIYLIVESNKLSLNN